MTVITDDPGNEEIPLTITGQVTSIYTLSQKSIKLTGVLGEKITQRLRIIPGRDYPFTVKEVTAKSGEKIRFHLEEIREGDAAEYELTVENTATDPGVYFDTLHLTTDSKVKPQIDISVVGRINAAKADTAGN